MTINNDPLVIEDEGSGDFKPLPPAPTGMVPAVCVYVEDIGMHTQTWQGETKTKRKVMIGWELAHKIQVEESEFNGKPYLLSKEYNFSMNERAALRIMLEGWRGKKYTAEEIKKGIDLRLLIGKQFCINVTHSDPKPDGRVFANVGQVTGPMEGMPELLPDLKELPKFVVEKKRAGGIILAEDISKELPGGSQQFDDVPF